MLQTQGDNETLRNVCKKKKSWLSKDRLSLSVLLVHLLQSRGACNHQNAIAFTECLLSFFEENTLEKSGIHSKMNLRDKYSDLVPKTLSRKTKLEYYEVITK